MVDNHDEGLHKRGSERYWQESWYFNWADADHNLFGLARIGFRFAEARVDGLLLLSYNGAPLYLYPAVNRPLDADYGESIGRGTIRSGNLVFQMKEPLQTWQLILTGRNTVDLEWSAFTTAYDYHSAEGCLIPNVSGFHFEQSGRVQGMLRVKNRVFPINGYGQRDKSWGVRDWRRAEGWNWISAQCGNEVAFNVWEGWWQGKQYSQGFINYNGQNHPVRECTIRLISERRVHQPGALELEIIDSLGNHFEITASVCGSFPLLKNGLWLEELCARFTVRDRGKSFSGKGIIEHTWRPGMKGMVKKIPVMVRTLGQLLKPWP